MAITYTAMHLPAELMISVMENLPDMATLSKLFTACPKAVAIFSETSQTSNKIFASIAANMSPELRYCALDVLAVRSRPPITPRRVSRLLKRHLVADVHEKRLLKRNHPLPAILDLIEISGSLESLTESFARDRVLGPCMALGMPLSLVERHRIQRAFWRFQLCYDMCHPEANRDDSPGSNNPAGTQGTGRYFKYPISLAPIIDNRPEVPDWLHCRGESYRPEALSRFLVNLSRWEQSELDAVRFHLIHEVNTIQYLRTYHPSSLPPTSQQQQLSPTPSLLLRLLRDLDTWNPNTTNNNNSTTDHLLIASFAETPQYSLRHPFSPVWDRKRYLVEASVRNTRCWSAIQGMQNCYPQWGWCIWDHGRFCARGMLDPGFEELVKERERGGGGSNDEELNREIWERGECVRRANTECAWVQWTGVDRWILDGWWVSERASWERAWEERRREVGGGWMRTELDCIDLSIFQ